jgi:hypothetical protein
LRGRRVGRGCAYGLGEADWGEWRGMAEAARTGVVGLLKVSNISFEQLATLIEGVKIARRLFRTVAYRRL